MDSSPLALWLHELACLFFPQSCAGCGEWDTPLCEACAQAIAGDFFDASWRAPSLMAPVPFPLPASGAHALGGVSSCGIEGSGEEYPLIPVWALGEYKDVRSQTIIAWKNAVNGPLTSVLTNLIAERVAADARRITASVAGHVDIVPAPSHRRRRHEGVFVAGHIARAVATGLNAAGYSARVADVLRQGRPGPSTPRTYRRAKAAAIRLARPGLRGCPVIIVDDVLTTGATLAGAIRALNRGGYEVRSGLVVAAAPVPHRRENRRESGDDEAGCAGGKSGALDLRKMPPMCTNMEVQATAPGRADALPDHKGVSAAD